MNPDPDTTIAQTRRWLERAVIGLNLCPFAKAVHARGQVHIAVTVGANWTPILDDLMVQASELLAVPAELRDTTLLVAPAGPADFVEFTGLVAQAERLLEAEALSGTLQLASFHPRFEFAGSDAGDIANCTNRSPWPTLHLLREASVDRAVAAFPDAADIYEANIRRLRQLGAGGWEKLWEDRA